jgi:putative peptidoglycan lipid II flippase
MTVIMLTATTLGMLLSDWIFPLIYSGTAKDIVSLAAQSSKALFPQVFFMMLAALCIGILNAYKKFSSTAFGPTVYNICVVVSILVFGKQTNQAVINTAIGITASAGVYFLLQFFMARRELKSFRLSLDIQDEGFRELLRLAVPTMISASIVQLNTIVITTFSGGFGEKSGIIQSLQNAKTIWQLPYGIFAVAVGSVMLPSLSAHFAAQDYKSARVLLGKSLRNALFLTIPSAGLLLALRHDVVPAILKWTSSYKIASGETTALILMGYCLAVIFQTVVFIYNQAFYAIGKTKIPLYTGALSMILITGFCFILKSLDLLKPGSVVGALGLSLAYSLTSIITALILSTLYRKDRQLAPRSIAAFIVRSCICLGVLLLVVYALNVFPVNPQSKFGQLVWLAVRASAGFGGYLLAARAMQMKELSSFVDRIRRKKNPAV